MRGSSCLSSIRSGSKVFGDKILSSSSGRPQLGKLGVSESDMGGGKDEKNLSVNGEWVD